MSFVLVFGLILMVIVPTTEGGKWIGTFENKGACNTTGCCCPTSQLVFVNIANGTAKSSFTPSGHICKTTGSITFGPTPTDDKTFTVADLGNFTLTNNENNLEVFLDQMGTDPVSDACKVTMVRSTSPSGGSKPSTSGGGASAGEALLNHGSILIKFISIIMTTTVIVYI